MNADYMLHILAQLYAEQNGMELEEFEILKGQEE